MDHLVRPYDPAANYLRVPYVLDQPYTGPDFLSFPARAGWAHALPSAYHPSFDASELQQPSEDSILEKFLQSWIFFGLLHELLQPQDLYAAHQYIDEDGKGQYVHTRSLIRTLERWQSLAKSWSEDDRAKKYRHMVGCLTHAHTALCAISNFSGDVLPNTTAVAQRRHEGFDRGIKASLASICEVISAVVDCTLVCDVEKRSTPLTWAHVAWDDLSRTQMTQRGWCPSEAAFAQQKLKSWTAHSFMRQMKKTDLGDDHGSCTEDDCKTLRIHPDRYVPAHVAPGCDCQMLGPDLEQVVTCLRNGTFPLLRIHGDSVERLALEVVEYTEGVRYVALSHVWADGLGNQKAIEIRRCQILKMKILVQQVQQQGKSIPEGDQDQELLFWCDSLLVPQERRDAAGPGQMTSKQLAMAKMYDAYFEAAFVLVLDRSLETYRLDKIGLFEAAIRVFTSRWMRRLWTFQEAVLAKTLLIQFEDGLVDVRDFWETAEKLQASSPAYWLIGGEIIMQCIDIRAIRHLDRMHSEASGLSVVMRGTHLRRSSVAADEPFCINTMLHLDSEAMARVERPAEPNSIESFQERRMKLLWTHMPNSEGGIPAEIIFHWLPRLQAPGFRWAPATLQHPTSRVADIFGLIRREQNNSMLSKHGLHVSYAAWELKVGPMASLPPEGLHQTNGQLHHSDGRCFWITTEDVVVINPVTGELGWEKPATTLWKLFQDRSRTYLLILETDRKEEKTFEQGRAILATLEQPESRTPIVRPAMAVKVALVRPSITTIWNDALTRATSLRNDPIVAELLAGGMPSEAQQQDELFMQRFRERMTHTFQRVSEESVRAMQQVEVATAARNEAPANPQKYIEASIHWRLSEWTLSIEKTYDSNSKWIIN